MPRGLLIDLSGVLYAGDAALPGAREAVADLQAQGLPHLFLTNTTRQDSAQLAAVLAGLGFAIAPEHILGAVDATLAHVRQRGLSPYPLVHPAVRAAFAALARGTPDAVVLGDAGEGFDYASLNHAFRLLMDGAELIAMGDNRYFRGADGLSLDIGPFKAALEFASGVKATVIGKPAPGFFLAGCRRLGLPPEAVLMIGDDAEADVAAALAAGLQGCLVCTGKYRLGDEARCPKAAVCRDLATALATVR